MPKSQHALSYNNVKKLLRELREDAGLTQRELAAKMRRPQPWVHKSEAWERRTDIGEFLEWCVGCAADPEEAFRRLIRKRQ